MSPSALALILSAACAHAGWNFFAKRVGAGGVAFVWLVACCGTICYLPVLVYGVATAGVPEWGPSLLGVVVSAVLHLGYFLLLQHGYSLGDMSVVYPLARGTGPLLSTAFAVVALHERPGAPGLLGAVLVVAGVFAIGFSDGLPRGGAGQWPGILFGLATGVLIAAYTVWDAHVVTALALSPLIFDWTSNLLRAIMLTPFVLGPAALGPSPLGRPVAQRRREALRLWSEHRRDVLLVGLLSPLAYILVLFAMRVAPVSLVAPGRELSIVFAVLLAWLLLDEPRPGRRLAGSSLVLAGVVMLGVA